jgi:hypothetical protein
MDEMARLPARDRTDLFTASAAKRGFNFIIIEKDFWACWVLKQLFGLHDPPAGLVFKGGTSLSKVWGIINRFSEDVDLSFNRSDLGFGGDADPARAPSEGRSPRSAPGCASPASISLSPPNSTSSQSSTSRGRRGATNAWNPAPDLGQGEGGSAARQNSMTRS